MAGETSIRQNRAGFSAVLAKGIEAGRSAPHEIATVIAHGIGATQVISVEIVEVTSGTSSGDSPLSYHLSTEEVGGAGDDQGPGSAQPRRYGGTGDGAHGKTPLRSHSFDPPGYRRIGGDTFGALLDPFSRRILPEPSFESSA